MNTRQKAERIERKAKRLGYSVSSREAQTGSVYLLCERNATYVTVRVADHMECYPPERGERKICVSQDELTADQALELLANPERIAPYTPAEPTAEQREAARELKERDERQKQNWQTVRASLSESDFAEWRERTNGERQNKQAVCRDMAAARGIGAGLLYAALMNGRQWKW